MKKTVQELKGQNFLNKEFQLLTLLLN